MSGFVEIPNAAIGMRDFVFAILVDAALDEKLVARKCSVGLMKKQIAAASAVEEGDILADTLDVNVVTMIPV